MNVYFFLKQRTDLIRHFYDAASAPFVETKKCIEDGSPPFDEPPYDESGEPPFLTEWLQADVEHELVGRAAVSMLSEALKQFFITWERRALTGTKPSCSKRFKKVFETGFINGYVACFAEGFDIDWSCCPADLDMLRQVVLVRNLAQHSDLVLDHLTHDERSCQAFPRLFFLHPKDEGTDADASPFLSPMIHVSRAKLLAAIEHAERLGSWIQQKIEEWQYLRWSNHQAN